MEDASRELANRPRRGGPKQGEVLSPYTLEESAAKRMGLKPGTKVMYIPQDDEKMKKILGADFNANAVYMKDIYTEDGTRRIGGTLSIDPNEKPEKS